MRNKNRRIVIQETQKLISRHEDLFALIVEKKNISKNLHELIKIERELTLRETCL